VARSITRTWLLAGTSVTQVTNTELLERNLICKLLI
jgi:hypothetical protein